VTGAIRQAAHSTGISFEYLLTTAKIESNFRLRPRQRKGSISSSTRIGSAQ
jgi:hypothetical protein